MKIEIVIDFKNFSEIIKKRKTLAIALFLVMGASMALLYGSSLNNTTLGEGSGKALIKYAAGNVIKAEDFNANFQELATAHNDLTAKLKGIVALFPGSCPSGWSEYSGAKGRVVVGTFGTAGQTSNELGAIHAALTSSAAITQVSKVPKHTHTTAANSTSSASNGSARGTPGGSTGYLWTTIGSGVLGSHSHTFTIPALTTNSTTDSDTNPSADSVDATMPYIQLTYCTFDSP